MISNLTLLRETAVYYTSLLTSGPGFSLSRYGTWPDFLPDLWFSMVLWLSKSLPSGESDGSFHETFKAFFCSSDHYIALDLGEGQTVSCKPLGNDCHALLVISWWLALHLACFFVVLHDTAVLFINRSISIVRAKMNQGKCALEKSILWKKRKDLTESLSVVLATSPPCLPPAVSQTDLFAT